MRGGVLKVVPLNYQMQHHMNKFILNNREVYDIFWFTSSLPFFLNFGLCLLYGLWFSFNKKYFEMKDYRQKLEIRLTLCGCFT